MSKCKGQDVISISLFPKVVNKHEDKACKEHDHMVEHALLTRKASRMTDETFRPTLCDVLIEVCHDIRSDTYC